MKYDNPFIFLFYYLGDIYYQLNKYNKAKFYLKKTNLITLFFIYKNKYKLSYYQLIKRYSWKMFVRKYFINIILMKI